MDDIPRTCYERSLSELYLYIWDQLVLNQRLQLFVQSLQSYLLIFFPKKLNIYPNIKKNECLNSAEQIPRNWNVDQLSVLITSLDIT